MNHEQVIQRFAARKINARSKTISWRGHNVYCNEHILYSYGSHFPLAYYLGEKDGQAFFLKNEDKYSSSTSCHQGLTQEHCYGPQLSFNKLAALDIDFLKIRLKNIIAWRPPERHFVIHNGNDNLYYSFEDRHTLWFPPNYGYFVPFYKREKTIIRDGCWNVDEEMIFKYEKKYYFVTKHQKSRVILKLNVKVETIEEALRMNYVLDKAS
jgi:hypothetical protein